MGTGLRVQLQVTLRVAQEVGGMRKSPWKWRHQRHGNDQIDYGLLYWVKQGRGERGSMRGAGDDVAPYVCRRVLMCSRAREKAKSFPQHTYSRGRDMGEQHNIFIHDYTHTHPEAHRSVLVYYIRLYVDAHIKNNIWLGSECCHSYQYWVVSWEHTPVPFSILLRTEIDMIILNMTCDDTILSKWNITWYQKWQKNTLLLIRMVTQLCPLQQAWKHTHSNIWGVVSWVLWFIKERKCEQKLWNLYMKKLEAAHKETKILIIYWCVENPKTWWIKGQSLICTKNQNTLKMESGQKAVGP